MTAEYNVRLVSPLTGAVSAIFDDFNSLYFYNKVNDFGYHIFSFDGNDARVANFLTDTLVQVTRRDQSAGIPWYTEYTGFHRTSQFQITDKGQTFFTSYGRSLEDLLHRREILWQPGKINAQTGLVAETKTAMAADDAMKQYVLENAGAWSTAANGRISDGVTSGLTIAGNLTAAPVWTGSRAYKNLHTALIEIAQVVSVDFAVVWTGGGTFTFSTFYPRMGTDRSGAGAAAPVVFSVEHANMSSPYLTRSRSDEVNSVTVLGQGDGLDRTIVQRTNPTAIAQSPWNLSEFTHDARNEAATTGLNLLGDAHLLAHAALQHLAFTVIPSPGSVYGKHYFLGDLVVGQMLGTQENKKISGVEITVADGKEDIRVHFDGDV